MGRITFPERVFVNFPQGTLDRIRSMSDYKGMTPATYMRVAVLAELRRIDGEKGNADD